MVPLVSAIMLASYPKRAGMIAQACASFLWQTYPNLELVVVNDGEPLVSLDPRVRVVQAQPGLTIGDKRNLGILAARGKYVATWDDDDISFPERIALHVKELRGDGAQSHRSATMWVSDKDLRIIGLLTDVCYPTSLMDREQMVLAGGYPAISYLEDMEMSGRFMLRGLTRTSSLSPVYVHRRHNANVSSAHSDQTVDTHARNADRSDVAAIAAAQHRLDSLLAQPQRPLLASARGEPLMYSAPVQPSGQATPADTTPPAAPAPVPSQSGTDRIVASIETAARQLGPLLTGTVIPILQRDKELQRTLGAAAGRAAIEEVKPILWFIAGTMAAGVFVYWARGRRRDDRAPQHSDY